MIDTAIEINFIYGGVEFESQGRFDTVDAAIEFLENYKEMNNLTSRGA